MSCNRTGMHKDGSDWLCPESVESLHGLEVSLNGWVGVSWVNDGSTTFQAAGTAGTEAGTHEEARVLNTGKRFMWLKRRASLRTLREGASYSNWKGWLCPSVILRHSSSLYLSFLICKMGKCQYLPHIAVEGPLLLPLVLPLNRNHCLWARVPTTLFFPSFLTGSGTVPDKCIMRTSTPSLCPCLSAIFFLLLFAGFHCIL